MLQGKEHGESNQKGIIGVPCWYRDNANHVCPKSGPSRRVVLKQVATRATRDPHPLLETTRL